MAIGRISGPMLFANLERQGLDLSIDGNLLYFDVNRRRIGVNTDLPDYTVHVTGDNGSTANVYINGTLIVNDINAGNIKANSIGITNQYEFPIADGPPQSALVTNGQGLVEWTKVGGITVERLIFNYTIPDLPSGAFHEFVMDIGLSSIVYGLTVSRPCLVEVFGTEQKNESNPYTFLATLGHLTDDGTIFFNDGTVLQQRQYSIFANQEDPPKNKVYARISNSDGVGGEVKLSMTYFAGITDNRAGSYSMNLVDTLPAAGYSGQTIVNTSNDTMYTWYNNKWNAVT